MKHCSSSVQANEENGRKWKKIKGRKEKAEMGNWMVLSHATCGSGRIAQSPAQANSIQSMHYFHNYSLSGNYLNSSDIQYTAQCPSRDW
jgi:hypothetical protein